MSRASWSPYYPFTGRTLDVRGQRMHYLDEGKGETVVMVHGNPTWSFYYRELVKALRDTHHCVVPDHIGMGLSSNPSDRDYDYRLASRIDDLAALIEKAAPKGPVALILHDWGGMIGMGWAARHPERVKSIVAFNTSCFRLPPEKSFPPLLGALRGPLGLPLRLSRFVRRRVLRTCVSRRPMPIEVERAYLDVCEGWNESRAVHRFVQDIPLGPGHPSWETVLGVENVLPRFSDTPMLLPWGMKDWVFDESFLNGWIQRFPKARVERFADCGHFLLEDAPERLVPMIAGFLARRPGAGPA